MAEVPDSGVADKAAHFRSRLAAAYQSAGRLSDAEAQMAWLLEAAEPQEGAAATGAQLDLLVNLGHVQVGPPLRPHNAAGSSLMRPQLSIGKESTPRSA